MTRAEKLTKDCVQWIKDWFAENGPDCNAVVGISGGKDSTIAAALCVEALGRDRVIGVLMPDGEQADIEDAWSVVRFLGIKGIEVNIESTVYSVYRSIATKVKISNQTEVNLPARVRMVTLYAISQSMNGRVVNTCNKSEDWVGYSTRYGDGAGDFSPLANILVRDVLAIGDYLKLPYELVHKVPSDGLCGKTDEDNLGFSYTELDAYISGESKPTPAIKDKIDRLHKQNLFKLQTIPAFNPKDVK